MNEYTQYLNDFQSGYWTNDDPKLCRCHGSGWALSELDTWHCCPVHYSGQSHPEDYVPEGYIEPAQCLTQQTTSVDDDGNNDELPF